MAFMFEPSVFFHMTITVLYPAMSEDDISSPGDPKIDFVSEYDIPVCRAEYLSAVIVNDSVVGWSVGVVLEDVLPPSLVATLAGAGAREPLTVVGETARKSPSMRRTTTAMTAQNHAGVPLRLGFADGRAPCWDSVSSRARSSAISSSLGSAILSSPTKLSQPSQRRSVKARSGLPPLMRRVRLHHRRLTRPVPAMAACPQADV